MSSSEPEHILTGPLGAIQNLQARLASDPTIPPSLRPYARTAMIVLWHHADLDGLGWPSFTMIGHEGDMSRREAIRAIKVLVDLEIIGIKERGGPGRSTTYVIGEAYRIIGQKDGQRGDSQAPDGDSQSLGVVTHSHLHGDSQAHEQVPINKYHETCTPLYSPKGDFSEEQSVLEGIPAPSDKPPKKEDIGEEELRRWLGYYRKQLKKCTGVDRVFRITPPLMKAYRTRRADHETIDVQHVVYVAARDDWLTGTEDGKFKGTPSMILKSRTFYRLLERYPDVKKNQEG